MVSRTDDRPSYARMEALHTGGSRRGRFRWLFDPVRVISDNGRCERESPVRYIAYLRVSTDQQRGSGLGLEAQREAVAAYLATRPGAVLVDEHVEVESGKRRDRPELEKALAAFRG